MKYLLAFSICVTFACSSLAQSKYSTKQKSTKKENEVTESYVLKQNEIRLNSASSIYGVPEINYERFCADNLGVGLAASITLLDSKDLEQRYSILPYARIYFGEKTASGFFFEANAALLGQEHSVVSGQDNSSVLRTRVGFGAAIGVKLVARNGIIGEVYSGGGRRFGDGPDGAYLRIGVCIGRRF